MSFHQSDSELNNFLRSHPVYARVLATVEVGGWRLLNSDELTAHGRNSLGVMAVNVGEGWRYPSMQFDESRAVHENLLAIMTFGGEAATGWVMLEWLVVRREKLDSYGRVRLGKKANEGLNIEASYRTSKEPLQAPGSPVPTLAFRYL